MAMVLYIDNAADTSQCKQLEDVFQGRKGGPMQIVSTLISKWLPAESTKIEVNDDGSNITASVGSVGQIKSQQLKNNQVILCYYREQVLLLYFKWKIIHSH
jgi:hypothetical protein